MGIMESWCESDFKRNMLRIYNTVCIKYKIYIHVISSFRTMLVLVSVTKRHLFGGFTFWGPLKSRQMHQRHPSMLTTKQMVNSPMLPLRESTGCHLGNSLRKNWSCGPEKINSPVNIHRMVDITLFLSHQLTSFCRKFHPVDIPLNIPLTIRWFPLTS